MKLNSVIFPAPENYFEFGLENQLLYIPKKKVEILPNTSKKSSKDKDEKEESKEELTKICKNQYNYLFEAYEYIPCLYLPYEDGSDKILIFFHGNAEDIGWASGFLNDLQDELKVHILAMEYPGYSNYIGTPDSNVILEDAELVYNFLLDEIGLLEENILLFGRSIGSGPATFLAGKYNPGALILMSAYTSIKAIVKGIAGNFGKALVAERFENVKEIRKVKSPSLFIHGCMDKLIPKEHSLELLNNCKDIISHIHLSETMTHNDFDFKLDLLEPIKSFLKNCDIKINPGQRYRFPRDLYTKPESIAGKKNKRSLLSKVFEKFG